MSSGFNKDPKIELSVKKCTGLIKGNFGKKKNVGKAFRIKFMKTKTTPRKVGFKKKELL